MALGLVIGALAGARLVCASTCIDLGFEVGNVDDGVCDCRGTLTVAGAP